MKKFLLLFILIAVSASWLTTAAAFEEVGNRPSRPAHVEVWLNKHNGSVYHPGQIVRAYFQTDRDCYVAVYNIDAEGFVHVLYPKYQDRAWVEGGRIYEIPDPYDNYDLVVDGPKGIEYVVAVASEFPLNLRALYDIEDGVVVDDDYWPLGRVTGDPHLAIHDINELLAWGNEEYEPEGYSSDVGWFYVREWVPYPRYIVYRWYPEYIYDPWWDPYVHCNIWIDFYWDHYWCRPWWWCRGCQPIHVYWYIDRDSGRRVTWKGDYHTDRRKPDWYREKPVRRGGGGERPSRIRDDDNRSGSWEDRRRSPWGDPGTEADEIRKRAQGREPVELERKQRESRRQDSGKTAVERDTRRSRTEINRETRSSERSPREIRRSPKPQEEKRSQEVIRRRSTRSSETRSEEKNRSRTRSSETKKVQKRSNRSSTIGKIFGGVAKIFTRDSNKKSSSSSKKSKSSDSGSDRSKKSSSSKSSSSSEKKSR
jgi:hypothetical protein